MSATTTAAGPTLAPASGSSYAQRAINYTIILGEGSFGTGGANTVTLPAGLRSNVSINKAVAPSMDVAVANIYGVPQTIMSQVTTLGALKPYARNNQIVIQAGDSVTGVSTVHQGAIQAAWQELDGTPETYLTVSSFSGRFAAMQPTKPTSYPGSADVATIISGLALQVQPTPRAFHNNGVQVQLANPYFAGTPLEQAQSCARAAGIQFYDDGATWFIWPQFNSRLPLTATVSSPGVASTSSTITPPGGNSSNPLISPASGLLLYPKYESAAMRFRCLYNPNIQAFGYITMQSSIIQANGLWIVKTLALSLSAQMPNGPWFCDVECFRPPTGQNT